MRYGWKKCLNPLIKQTSQSRHFPASKAILFRLLHDRTMLPPELANINFSSRLTEKKICSSRVEAQPCQKTLLLKGMEKVSNLYTPSLYYNRLNCTIFNSA